MKTKIFITIISLFTLLNAQKLEYHLLKPQRLYIGTPFQILVKINSTLEDTVYSTKVDTLDIFVLKGDIEEKKEVTDSTKTTNLTLTFQPFDVGEYTFPPLEFLVKNKEKQKTLSTGGFVLNVLSSAPDTTSVIKDIASPIGLHLKFTDYLFLLLLLALIVIIIIVTKKLLRKKDKTAEVEIEKDTRPAFVIALELLKKLKSKKLLEKGEFLKYHFRLSYILRFFIEKNYKINAVEMTTSEIRDYLQIDDFKEKSEILQFLSAADRIKFAKFIPEPNESRVAMDWLDKYLHKFEKMVDEGQIENPTQNKASDKGE